MKKHLNEDLEPKAPTGAAITGPHLSAFLFLEKKNGHWIVRVKPIKEQK